MFRRRLPPPPDKFYRKNEVGLNLKKLQELMSSRDLIVLVKRSALFILLTTHPEKDFLLVHVKNRKLKTVANI